MERPSHIPEMNRANLVFRFLLELSALAATGWWGFGQGGWWAAIAFPVGLAVVWGVFNVPGDPSRSGKAPVVVPGVLRLAIEFSVFGCGGFALFDMDQGYLGVGYIVAVIVHYAFSHERLKWLINR